MFTADVLLLLSTAAAAAAAATILWHYTTTTIYGQASPVKSWSIFWSKVLLPACPCRWQLVHSDARVVPIGVASLPSNSVPLTADVLLQNCSTHRMYCYQIAVSLLSRNYEGQFPFSSLLLLSTPQNGVAVY